MKFALATANMGKIVEMQNILSKLKLEALTRDELGIAIDIEETGTTFYENALIKANAICTITGLPAIADDSGLCVKALDDAPGVYSSEYGGITLTDTERCEYLLKNMKNMEHREAKFVCNIVCVFPNGDVLTAKGECRGEILKALHGVNGFGYDPVFRPNGYEKSMAELTLEEKNTISHRGKALNDFSQLLMNYEK